MDQFCLGVLTALMPVLVIGIIWMILQFFNDAGLK